MPPGKRRLLQRYIQQLRLINALEQPMAALTDEELAAQTADFRARLAAGTPLDSLLVEAFAVVREASKRVLGMRPYDVQLVGAMALHEGKVAEMQTGEGKTLVAAITAYLNALPGKGVHVITVNDYLATRDAGWVGKVLRFLGLSVGAITGTNQVKSLGQRMFDREQFLKDVTYTTALELGFSFLMDQIADSPSSLVHVRPLNFAIIDEADYVLIDEAQQPLIMSTPLVDDWEVMQERLRVGDAIAQQLIADDALLTAGPPPGGDYPQEEVVFREAVQRGLHARYPEWVDPVNGTHHRYLCTYNLQQKSADMTLQGMQRAVELLVERGVVLPGGVGGPGALWGEDLPWGVFVMNALKARLTYRKDIDYILERNAEGELVVVIISTATGRRLDVSRWELHPAVEAKEGATIRPPNAIRAFITYALFFSYYSKVAGMTGTATTEEPEFLEAYNLSVVQIPSHRPVRRVDVPLTMFVDRETKYRYIQQLVIRARLQQQPVLLGTSSVQESEDLHDHLRALLPFPINVLNARPDRVASESRVIALAGLPGAVTIATSMAGRGTDILLGGNPKVLTQLELELSLLPALTQGGRSSSGGQAHLVAYRSTFAVHLEALAAEPAYAAARGSVHEAAQAWVAERGGLDRAAGQALVADVLEECEELRAKYVRWARHHRHGEGAPRGAVSRLDLLRDCLERVEAFWEAHHGDRLSGTESPAHGRRDPVLLDALRQLALHVWVQGDPGTTLALFDLQDPMIALSSGPALVALTHLLDGVPERDRGLMDPTVELAVKQLQGEQARWWREARLRSLETDRADDVYRKHMYTKRRVLLCGTEQQRTELVYSFVKELVDSMCRRHIDCSTSPAAWHWAPLFTELDHLINPQAAYSEVALLLDRDGYGDMRSPLLRLPLEPSDTGAIVAALHSKDVQGALQAHLAMPVQTGIGVRLLNNLTRMQRRLLGEEELELLPFVGKWAPQAALLRDQLALLCVLSYETKKTLWMQETSRMSGYLESLELLQEQHRQFEVTQLLSTLDHHWSRFLLVTRSLKEGVNVRAYSNLNATVEYSLDLTVLFDDMLHSFREDAVRQLFIGPTRIPKVLQQFPVLMPTVEGLRGEEVGAVD